MNQRNYRITLRYANFRVILIFKSKLAHFMKSSPYYLIFSVLIFFSISASAQLKQKMVDPKETTMKFNTLMQLINYYYVEDVDQPKLTEEAIVAVLNELESNLFRKC